MVRSARWYDLGEPSAAIREVWVALHGYRQLAGRFLPRFEALDDGTRWIVAPEALSRFYVEETVGRHGPGSRVGATWMTREDRLAEIDDYVAYLDRLAEVLFAEVDRAAVRLVVLGFSQGVATAARWAVQGAWPADTLVAWGDALPPDLEPAAARARLGEQAVVVVRGEADRSHSPKAAEGDVARLEGWGARPRAVLHPGGHRVEEAALVEVARGIRGTAPPPSRQGLA